MEFPEGRAASDDGLSDGGSPGEVIWIPGNGGGRVHWLVLVDEITEVRDVG